MRTLFVSVWLLLIFPARTGAASPAPAPRSNSSPDGSAPVKTGAAVLAERDFERFQGKTVGLIANPTSRVDTARVVDLMHRAGIEIGALFGPEHGVRGTAEAGEKVSGGRDPVTGAPIYSLYGATRKPTPEMLEGLDVLIYDLQDVGARFYSRLSTMGLAMQAAAEAGLPFVVLDRPNPLGGTYVSGFVREPAHRSFVGKYPIPVAYGLTAGELARMIKGEGWLPGLTDLTLEVVEIKGWERSMRWPETGLEWTPTSPNLPTFETALAYAGTCFFEAAAASEGRGTPRPFVHLGAPWADGQTLADTLQARGLEGVHFEAVRFTPTPNAGDSSPKFEGRRLEGVRIHVTDPALYRPVEVGIHTLHAFFHQARRKGVERFVARPEWLEKLAGTARLQALLREGTRPAAITASWQRDVETFRERRRPYLLY